MDVSSYPKDYSTLLSYSFPHKLQILLNSEDPDAAQWSADGNSFRILDKNLFVGKIVPKYFKRE
jgi:hypothetical protein